MNNKGKETMEVGVCGSHVLIESRIERKEVEGIEDNYEGNFGGGDNAGGDVERGEATLIVEEGQAEEEEIELSICGEIFDAVLDTCLKGYHYTMEHRVMEMVADDDHRVDIREVKREERGMPKNPCVGGEEEVEGVGDDSYSNKVGVMHMVTNVFPQQHPLITRLDDIEDNNNSKSLVRYVSRKGRRLRMDEVGEREPTSEVALARRTVGLVHLLGRIWIGEL